MRTEITHSENSRPGGLSSVRRAIRLLRLFTPYAPEWRAIDMSRVTGLPPSAISRLASTLLAGGLLERDPATRRFRPGFLALQLGALYAQHNALRELALRTLRAVVGEVDQVGYLGILDGRDLVVTATVENARPVRVVVQPGDRSPAYVTAIGKAILACMPEPEVRALFPDPILPIPPGIVGPGARPLQTVEQLIEDLNATRERGFSLLREERFQGVCAVGVALPVLAGLPPTGMSIAMPAFEATEERLAQIGQRLKAAAQALAAQLAQSLALAPSRPTELANAGP